MTSTGSNQSLTDAQLRAAYERLLERWSALTSIDTLRYERLVTNLDRVRPTVPAHRRTRFLTHLEETERLTANVLASLARLARHLDSPL